MHCWDILTAALLPRKAIKIPTPPPPSILLSSPPGSYYVPRPRGKNADSPVAVLYRIYWAIVMDDTIAMRNELEYFWTQKGVHWKVENIPKPPDPDPERFAIISAIPYALVAAFNRLINLGLPREASTSILSSDDVVRLAKEPKLLEKVPQWAAESPPLAQPLYLPTKGSGIPPDAKADGVDPFMKEKNVLVWALHVYFT